MEGLVRACEIQMAVGRCMMPPLDAVQGRHRLVQALCEWTGIRAWEILGDTDVDDAWDGDRVLATLKGHRAHAFVWITADGDAYGISVPSLVSFMDVMVEPTATRCVFCTCAHLDRMVPIRYVPDRTLLWHVRATIGRYPMASPSMARVFLPSRT